MSEQNETTATPIGRTFTLPEGLVIDVWDVDPRPGATGYLFGEITASDLKSYESDSEEDEEFNAAMDGIEALVLAHARAGIDIESPAYVEGLETAVGACADNL